MSVLKPVQECYQELLQDKTYIDAVIKENAQIKANYYATKTLA
ncbi:hypothetical protein RBB56_18125 [Kineothrix sp. MB12-C1]|nr:hypothetical protein [Kineothrix sp. MB12-C1]WMC92705.1 hypothetical protein RBB56_18125 [Kineothrix sp. MB12-C1]